MPHYGSRQVSLSCRIWCSGYQKEPIRLTSGGYPACAARGRGKRLASSTARMLVKDMPSKVPAPPIEATGAPRPRTLSRLVRSAPISVPRLPAILASGDADFDDFWDSNTVPVGPQGKVIAGMSPDVREQLRVRLREQLPATSNGQILYESFANAVRGRVRG